MRVCDPWSHATSLVSCQSCRQAVYPETTYSQTWLTWPQLNLTMFYLGWCSADFPGKGFEENRHQQAFERASRVEPLLHCAYARDGQSLAR
jgi:hypothetical protein